MKMCSSSTRNEIPQLPNNAISYGRSVGLVVVVVDVDVDFDVDSVCVIVGIVVTLRCRCIEGVVFSVFYSVEVAKGSVLFRADEFSTITKEPTGLGRAWTPSHLPVIDVAFTKLSINAESESETRRNKLSLKARNC